MSGLPARNISVHAIPAIPLIAGGDNVADLIWQAMEQSGMTFCNGDALVLAQKIVSKAENRLVYLRNVQPTTRAVELAEIVSRDPRIIELVLQESVEVLRAVPGVIIVRHRLGLVLANAGIDQSNVSHQDGEQALLLPLDPDLSCRVLAGRFRAISGSSVAVVVVDSLGRAWRRGTVGTAIGSSGIPALLNLRGRRDIFGRELMTSELGYADEIAAAASLVMGQAAECCPAVIVRGLSEPPADGHATDLVRPLHMDLFR